MLDRRFVVENSELVRRNCAERDSQADVDRFVALETQRKTKQAELEKANRKANEVSKSIGKAKDAAERDSAQGRRAASFAKRPPPLQPKSTRSPPKPTRSCGSIPNLSHPDAPRGADDQANLELRRGKTPPPKFDFKPLDHVELGEKLGPVRLRRRAPRSPATAFTFSRTTPCCWNWRCSATRSTC